MILIDVRAAEFRVDAALVHGYYPVGQLLQLFHIAGDEQNGKPLFPQLLDDVVDVTPGGRVDAAGGFV